MNNARRWGTAAALGSPQSSEHGCVCFENRWSFELHQISHLPLVVHLFYFDQFGLVCAFLYCLFFACAFFYCPFLGIAAVFVVLGFGLALLLGAFLAVPGFAAICRTQPSQF